MQQVTSPPNLHPFTIRRFQTCFSFTIFHHAVRLRKLELETCQFLRWVKQNGWYLNHEYIFNTLNVFCWFRVKLESFCITWSLCLNTSLHEGAALNNWSSASQQMSQGPIKTYTSNTHTGAYSEQSFVECVCAICTCKYKDTTVKPCCKHMQILNHYFPTVTPVT